MALDSDRILREVRENLDRLQSCDLHHFEPIGGSPAQFNARFLCRNCGGEVSRGAAQYYELGLLHARRAVSQPVIPTAPCRKCGDIVGRIDE